MCISATACVRQRTVPSEVCVTISIAILQILLASCSPRQAALFSTPTVTASPPPLSPADTPVVRSAPTSTPTRAATRTPLNPPIARDNLRRLSILASWETGPLRDLAFARDSSWFAASQDDGLHAYFVPTLEEELIVPDVLDFAFSGDGSALLVTSFFGETAVYDPRDLARPPERPASAPCRLQYDFALGNAASTLASAWEIRGGRNELPVWAVGLASARSRECLEILPAIDGEVVSIEFDGADSYLATSTTWSTTFVWSIAENRLSCALRGFDSRFNPSEPTIAVFEGPLIVLWDPTTCQVVHRLGGMPDDSFPWLVDDLMDFTPDGILLAAALGPALLFWDTDDVELVHQIDLAPQTFERVAISPDGRYMVTENHEWIEGAVSLDGRLLLWAVED